MQRFGELPSDLRKQDHSVGPPPAWWSPYGVRIPPVYPTQNTYPSFNGLHGYELNGNAIEAKRAEKYFSLFEKTLKINKNIPKVAAKYTSIAPMSPLFRNDISKSGFGDLDTLNQYALKGLALIGAFVVGRWAIKKYL